MTVNTDKLKITENKFDARLKKPEPEKKEESDSDGLEFTDMPVGNPKSLRDVLSKTTFTEKFGAKPTSSGIDLKRKKVM